MLRALKIIGFMLLGAVIVVGITGIVIAIGGVVNHITFGEQITQWFGSIGKQAVDTGKDIVQTTLHI